MEYQTAPGFNFCNNPKLAYDNYQCPICGMTATTNITIGSGGRGNSIMCECKNCGAKTDIATKPPFRGRELPENELTEIFTKANIPILGKYKIKNEYWTNRKDEWIDYHPWWLVKTSFGLIKIGIRKRVIEIDWSDTDIRKIVTEDNVTKNDTMVHAWEIEKAVTYLTKLIRPPHMSIND